MMYESYLNKAVFKKNEWEFCFIHFVADDTWSKDWDHLCVLGGWVY